MKRKLTIFFVTALLLTLSSPASFAESVQAASVNISEKYNPRAMNDTEVLRLGQCYDYSLIQSEKIAMNTELIKQAEAHFIQALGIILPHISYYSEYGQEDTGKPNAPADAYGIDSKSTQANFTIKQTVFNGFKEFAAMKGSNCEKRQRTYEKARAEQLLLVDVTDAYYLLAERFEDILSLEEIRGAFEERVRTLTEREKIGRSRESEVVNAQTQVYTVEAEIITQKNQVTILRNLLEFLTGVPVKNVAYMPINNVILAPESIYTAKVNNRPDVKALYEAWQLEEQAIIVANSDALPSVSFENNNYVLRSNSYKDIGWDVTLKVNIPIMNGTETIGAVSAARSKARSKKLEWERAKRLAFQNIKDAYSTLSNAIANHRMLKRAMESAKLNYDLQKKDYDLSLVSNLDVLASIQTLHDARRKYIHSLFEVKRLWYTLLLTTGDATKDKLDESI